MSKKIQFYIILGLLLVLFYLFVWMSVGSVVLGFFVGVIALLFFAEYFPTAGRLIGFIFMLSPMAVTVWIARDIMLPKYASGLGIGLLLIWIVSVIVGIVGFFMIRGARAGEKFLQGNIEAESVFDGTARSGRENVQYMLKEVKEIGDLFDKPRHELVKELKAVRASTPRNVYEKEKEFNSSLDKLFYQVEKTLIVTALFIVLFYGTLYLGNKLHHGGEMGWGGLILLPIGLFVALFGAVIYNSLIYKIGRESLVIRLVIDMAIIFCMFLVFKSIPVHK